MEPNPTPTPIRKPEPDSKETIQKAKELVRKLDRYAKKCHGDSNACLKTFEKIVGQIKEAIREGNIDGANILVKTAIGQKRFSKKHLKNQSVLIALSHKVSTAIMSHQTAEDMKELSDILVNMNAINNVESMDRYIEAIKEKFEDFDKMEQYFMDELDIDADLSGQDKQEEVQLMERLLKEASVGVTSSIPNVNYQVQPGLSTSENEIDLDELLRQYRDKDL